LAQVWLNAQLVVQLSRLLMKMVSLFAVLANVVVVVGAQSAPVAADAKLPPVAAPVGFAAAPKDDKSAAVTKVITLLEDLKKKVMEEGNEEAKTYDQFACFCKDNIKEKQGSIKSGKDNKAKLSTAIGEDSAKRDKLDADIKKLVDTIKATEKAMAKAMKENKAAVEEHAINSADLKNAIAGLDGAIGVLKTNKKATPSFMQLSEDLQATIQTSLVMADALGFASAGVVTELLQKASAPSSSLVSASTSMDKIEPYAFHSDDIISTLDTLLGDFKKEKGSVDSAEKKRKDAHDKFMQTKKDLVKKKGKEMDDKQDEKAKTTAQLATESKDLSGISAQLLDDMDYLKELAQICSDKAKTWDSRMKVRADELSALAAAIGIVKGTVSAKTSKGTVRLIQQKFSSTRAKAMVQNEDAMEAAEEDAETLEDSGSSSLSFLQRRQRSPHFGLDGVGMATRELQKELDHSDVAGQAHVSIADASASAEDGGRQAIMMLLRKTGVSLHSSMLTSLAERIASDPFAKVKKLIQELIERMLSEAANEANQKGWCDKSIGDAEQKREYQVEKLEGLNANMAEFEARRDTLVEDLAILAKEIEELTKAQKDADASRKKEKAENKATVEEAKAGLDAVQQAIQILDRFYKTAAQSKVDTKLIQGPKDDMPDAGFDSGEAYTGAQGDAGGVIGMLEVIESDFSRTVSKTEEAEAQADDDHLKFTTETQSSLAVKKQATVEKTAQKDDTLKNLEEATDGMKTQTDLLVGTIKELLELQPACVDTGMSYKERVAAREAELKALQKALCIFEAYAKFGPDGAGNAC